MTSKKQEGDRNYYIGICCVTKQKKGWDEKERKKEMVEGERQRERETYLFLISAPQLAAAPPQLHFSIHRASHGGEYKNPHTACTVLLPQAVKKITMFLHKIYYFQKYQYKYHDNQHSQYSTNCSHVESHLWTFFLLLYTGFSLQRCEKTQTVFNVL